MTDDATLKACARAVRAVIDGYGLDHAAMVSLAAALAGKVIESAPDLPAATIAAYAIIKHIDGNLASRKLAEAEPASPIPS